VLRLKGLPMAEIVGFVSKSELERLRLVREARAIYDSIFPPDDAARGAPQPQPEKGGATALQAAKRSTRTTRRP